MAKCVGDGPELTKRVRIDGIPLGGLLEELFRGVRLPREQQGTTVQSLRFARGRESRCRALERLQRFAQGVSAVASLVRNS